MCQQELRRLGHLAWMELLCAYLSWVGACSASSLVSMEVSPGAQGWLEFTHGYRPSVCCAHVHTCGVAACSPAVGFVLTS